MAAIGTLIVCMGFWGPDAVHEASVLCDDFKWSGSETMYHSDPILVVADDDAALGDSFPSLAVVSLSGMIDKDAGKVDACFGFWDHNLLMSCFSSEWCCFSSSFAAFLSTWVLSVIASPCSILCMVCREYPVLSTSRLMSPSRRTERSCFRRRGMFSVFMGANLHNVNKGASEIAILFPGVF